MYPEILSSNQNQVILHLNSVVQSNFINQLFCPIKIYVPNMFSNQNCNSIRPIQLEQRIFNFLSVTRLGNFIFVFKTHPRGGYDRSVVMMVTRSLRAASTVAVVSFLCIVHQIA